MLAQLRLRDGFAVDFQQDELLDTQQRRRQRAPVRRVMPLGVATWVAGGGGSGFQQIVKLEGEKVQMAGIGVRESREAPPGSVRSVCLWARGGVDGWALG